MSFFGIPMRNGLPLGLGTVASLTNGPGFLPSELFYNGTVQGAWYDPSDLTTLFQDSAGTTPVTAVEQPVGLMLDKSQGLVLGSELGASLNSAGSWTAYGSNTVVGSGGEITITFVGGVNSAFGAFASTSSLGLTVGRRYLFEFEVKINTGSATPYINDGVANITFSTSSPTYEKKSCRFLYSGAGVIQINNDLSAGEVITFRGFSVREIAGNHAYQTTSASRPTLRARYNLLTYSEQFDNAAWAPTSATVVPNAGTAPDGTVTADLIYPTTTGTIRGAYQAFTASATTYTGSLYVKAAGKTAIRLIEFPGSLTAASVDLTTGAVSGVLAGYTVTTVDAKNGWWRVIYTASVSAGTRYFQFMVTDNVGTSTATTNGTDGVLFWGAQLVPTAVFPSNTYQRIGAATDYATGAAFPPYLFFDGVDDSMLTNSVDFSGTDKMLVVAGVTKQSDAAGAILAELSASVATNNGSFYIAAPTNVLPDFGFLSRGTAAQLVTASPYAAPVTVVATGIGNIAGAVSAIRINGFQVGINTTSQGTGNFGNYPLYIGRRNNASLPFNGNIYSLIVAGQSYVAGQITSTEQWVAARTPLGTI